MTDTQVEQIARVLREADAKDCIGKTHAKILARAILPFITAAHESGRQEGAAEMRERAAELVERNDMNSAGYMAEEIRALPLLTPPQEG
jgi:hypothetical protein